MEFADLHLHSCYSRHPAEWFLKRLGTQESYTDIDTLYTTAKQRGMTYVTLTDHNTIDGALELKRKYPEDTFVSSEITTYFPENGCKIHILVFDIDEDQFKTIDTLRPDIYALREYLFSADIVHSVAHATYNINDKLDIETVEKLLLLFNTFEGINGSRSPWFAGRWMELLRKLNEKDLADLSERHGIRPVGPTPWKKNLTGGSDDHAGLFQGKTWTAAPAGGSYKAFLKSITEGKTVAGGRSHNFKSFAFSIYKIAYDFSRHKAGSDMSKGMFEIINRMLFEGIGLLPVGNTDALIRADKKDEILHEFLIALSQDLTESNEADMEGRINRIYDNISILIDRFFVLLMDSVETGLKNSSPGTLLKNFFAAIPFFFLSTPFVSSMRHLSKDRLIIEGLEKQPGVNRSEPAKTTLWFTDTIHDLNGVSVSLRQIAAHAGASGRNLKLVICHPDTEKNNPLPDNIMTLETIYELKPEFYQNYTLRFPSLLKAIDRIAQMNPDKIIISTPGPTGIVGLIAARMLGVPAIGIYHTDFKLQTEKIIKDPMVESFVLQYDKFFYSMLDEIRSPSEEYIRILTERGYPSEKLKLFKRGIDNSRFYFNETKKETFTIIWAGRISHDKNISWLISLFKDLKSIETDIELKIAGDGPAFEYFQKQTADIDGITMIGSIQNRELPDFYNSGDLFIFPSVMDTFGMVILEAQSCGIPCIVTDKGGPGEIVSNGKGGHIIPLTERERWIETARHYIIRKRTDTTAYSGMKQEISKTIQGHYCWENALSDIVGPPVIPFITEPRENNESEKAVSGF